MKKMLNRSEGIILEELANGKLKPLRFLEEGINYLTETLSAVKNRGKVDFYHLEGKFAEVLGYIEKHGMVNENELKDYVRRRDLILNQFNNHIGIKTIEPSVSVVQLDGFKKETPNQEKERRGRIEESVGGFVDTGGGDREYIRRVPGIEIPLDR